MTAPRDGEKLRMLADWLDATDPLRNDEVQQDLRRMAVRLDEMDGIEESR